MSKILNPETGRYVLSCGTAGKIAKESRAANKPTLISSLDFVKCETNGDYIDKVQTLMLEQPHLEDVDCIAMQTGHTHLIIRRYYLLEILEASVVFTDDSFAPELNPRILNKRVYDMVKYLCEYNTVVFDRQQAGDVFSLIDLLHQAQYCGECHVDCIQKMEWYETNEGKRVLLCVTDCHG